MKLAGMVTKGTGNELCKFQNDRTKGWFYTFFSKFGNNDYKPIRWLLYTHSAAIEGKWTMRSLTPWY